MQGVLGQKLGMTVVFREDRQIPVTAVKVDGNVVVGKRTEARDGYNALILGVGEQRVSRLSRPVVGQFRAAGLVDERDGQELVKRHVREFRVTAEQLEAYTVGQAVKITDLFKVGEKADVTSTSKGRGFSGVMKRHNFSGFKASHGVHESYRGGGSIGASAYPSRVFPGTKMPGRYGGVITTTQNVRLVRIDADDSLYLLRGAVPGAKGGLVTISPATKKRR